MRPKLPLATPSGFPPSEAVTGKMSALSEERQKCPACGGKILLRLDPVVPTGTPDVHRYGTFMAVVCLFCAESSGLVTAAEAETIRGALKKE